jgi:hypothetical protein
VLLELPIPQIFVIENADGVLELIDGLQRVSSIIQFVDPEALAQPPLTLQGCDLIEGLNGYTYNELPLSLRLRLKRSSVRMIVVKRQSKSFLRYAMFKRLNTGGAALAPQEIRNCSARMIGEAGDRFYSFLQDCSSTESFRICTETMSTSDLEKKGDEELVLRFFAVKNAQDLFRGSVRDWLDTYMEQVIMGHKPFDYDDEMSIFADLFKYLAVVMGTGAFVKYRGQVPVGALAPAYYEAVSGGIVQLFPNVLNADGEKVKETIINTVQSDNFRNYTGPGANSREKLQARVETIRNAVAGVF